jgi:hypothetical protein
VPLRPGGVLPVLPLQTGNCVEFRGEKHSAR